MIISWTVLNSKTFYYFSTTKLTQVTLWFYKDFGFYIILFIVLLYIHYFILVVLLGVDVPHWALWVS